MERALSSFCVKCHSCHALAMVEVIVEVSSAPEWGAVEVALLGASLKFSVKGGPQWPSSQDQNTLAPRCDLTGFVRVRSPTCDWLRVLS